MWRAYLYQSVNGNIGPQIHYESLKWSNELNGIESIQLGLRKSELPKVDLKRWLDPWWAGVVLFWNDIPVIAGPITTRPYETATTVSVNCGGIRSILANRIVVKEQDNWDNLNKSELVYTGMSLGTIAKKIVQVAQAKPGGGLPITFPIPDETVNLTKNPNNLPLCSAEDGSYGPNPCYWDGDTMGNKSGVSFYIYGDETIFEPSAADHTRTYKGFNVQNLSADEVLTKLSNVTDGPDIMFKPRLVRDNKLTFDMFYGLEGQPRIRQSAIPVWDTTPQRGQVSEAGTIYTGTYQTSRVYSLGAGQDEGVLMTVNTNTKPIQQGYPLLEKVINIGNSEDKNVVRNYGLAELETNDDPLLEIQLTVRGDTPMGFGAIWPGDLAHIHVKDWISLPDGLTPMRILSMSGDESANVKLSLQKEEKFL